MKALFYRDWLAGHTPEIIDEIFVRKIYEPYIKTDGVYLDLGANIGLWTMWAYPHASRIIAVEPSSDHFETFTKMLEYNKMTDKVTPLKVAISNQNTELNFYHVPNTTANSLIKIADSLVTEVEKVKAITLKTLFEEQKIDHVDLMKMDIEGEEMKVIASSEFDEIAPKIDKIVFEYHSFTGIGKNNIITSLKDRGYDVLQLDANATVFYAGR